MRSRPAPTRGINQEKKKGASPALCQQLLRHARRYPAFRGDGRPHKFWPEREIGQKPPALTILHKFNAVVSTNRPIPSEIQQFQEELELSQQGRSRALGGSRRNRVFDLERCHFPRPEVAATAKPTPCQQHVPAPQQPPPPPPTPAPPDTTKSNKPDTTRLNFCCFDGVLQRQGAYNWSPQKPRPQRCPQHCFL